MDNHPNAPGNDNGAVPEKPTREPEITGPTTALAEQTLAVDLARADIDQAIATAHRFPRRLEIVVKKIEQRVLFSEATADRCVYALPRGGKPIVGPSIGFMDVVASAWGNCRVKSEPTYVDRRDKLVYARGVFLDLESNVTTDLTVSRRISDKRGQIYNDDMIMVTAMAAASIARRNAIRHAVDEGLWHPVYEKALYVVRGSEETLPQRREAALKALAHFGIDAKRIFMFLNVSKLEEVGVEHMPTLRGMFTLLKEGTITAEELLDPRKMTGRVFDTVEQPLADEDEAERETEDSPAQGTASPAGAGAGQASPAAQAQGKANGAAEPNTVSGTGQPATASHGASPERGEVVASGKGLSNPDPDDYKQAKAEEQDADKFPEPWIRQTGLAYLAYAIGWMGRATSRAGIDDRWKAERKIRSGLGTTLDEDQHATLLKAKAEAEARFK